MCWARRRSRPTPRATPASRSRSRRRPRAPSSSPRRPPTPSGNTSEFSQEFGIDHPPTARMSFTTLTVNEGVPVTFDGSGSSQPRRRPAHLLLDLRRRRRRRPAPRRPTPTLRPAPTSRLDGERRIRRDSTATATITVVDVPPAFTPNSFTPPETYTAPARQRVRRVGRRRSTATWRSAHRTATALGHDTGVGRPLRWRSHRRRRLDDLRVWRT